MDLPRPTGPPTALEMKTVKSSIYPAEGHLVLYTRQRPLPLAAHLLAHHTDVPRRVVERVRSDPSSFASRTRSVCHAGPPLSLSCSSFLARLIFFGFGPGFFLRGGRAPRRRIIRIFSSQTMYGATIPGATSRGRCGKPSTGPPRPGRYCSSPQRRCASRSRPSSIVVFDHLLVHGEDGTRHCTEGNAAVYSGQSALPARFDQMRNADNGNPMKAGKPLQRFQQGAHERVAVRVSLANIGRDWVDHDQQVAAIAQFPVECLDIGVQVECSVAAFRPYRFDHGYRGYVSVDCQQTRQNGVCRVVLR